MAPNMKRFMLSLTGDLEEVTDELRQSVFYNTSKAEMLRYLIALGLETAKENHTIKNSKSDEDSKYTV